VVGMLVKDKAYLLIGGRVIGVDLSEGLWLLIRGKDGKVYRVEAINECGYAPLLVERERYGEL